MLASLKKSWVITTSVIAVINIKKQLIVAAAVHVVVVIFKHSLKIDFGSVYKTSCLYLWLATFAKRNQVTYNNFISHQSFDNMHMEISLRIQCTCLESDNLNPSFNPSIGMQYHNFANSWFTVFYKSFTNLIVFVKICPLQSYWSVECIVANPRPSDRVR